MRGVSVGLFAISSTVPVSSALAANCYWYTGYWYCDAGCSISRRWWDADGREWINYSCTPSLARPSQHR